MQRFAIANILLGPMLNLASVKYANCFQPDGGPIHKLEESYFEIRGKQYAVANATLVEGLCRKADRNKVYSSADGSGVHRNPVTARHIAISEALERWAHHQLWNSEYAEQYGFDQDPTSNGMSAFPGLFPQQARSFAYLEAVERFTLFSWWQGLTDAEVIDVPEWTGDCYRLDHPFDGCEVILLREFDDLGNYPCYGYGSGKNRQQAFHRAVIELERSRFVLNRFFERNPGFEYGDLSILDDTLEKRLVYFSLPEGIRDFEKRIRAKKSSKKRTGKPEVIFDGEIPGPWSRFATVWRTSFRMPSRDFISPHKLYFFW